MEQLSRLKLYEWMLNNQSINSNNSYRTMLETNIQVLSSIENLFLSPDRAPEQKTLIDPEIRDTLAQNLAFLANRNNLNSHTQSLLKRLRELLDKYYEQNEDAIARPRNLFNGILNELAEYGRRVLQSNSIPIVGRERENRPQVFLSHAYDDRLYSWAVFEFFYDKGVFLYVDWMNQKKQDDGCILKDNLENALDQSEQLLFLRSANSELDINGKHIIRPWCSWELGNFHIKNKDEKYFLNLYSIRDYGRARNIQIHGMKLFDGVAGQRLTGQTIHYNGQP